MIVGIITGTYSSVFIASAIVVLWQSAEAARTGAAAAAGGADRAGEEVGQARPRVVARRRV